MLSTCILQRVYGGAWIEGVENDRYLGACNVGHIRLMIFG